MSATFLEFRERKAAERSAAKRLPPWVIDAAYVQIAFRVPRSGEFFYGPLRDKVMLCNADETQEFAIVEYRGGQVSTTFLKPGVLALVRDGASSIAPTTGELLVEGEFFCYTLELPWLNNLAGKSCIPCGQYRVILSLSTRFKREMPRLIGVPGRLGILIHPGNTEADTEGCILLGKTRGDGATVLDSRIAFGHFLEWLASVGNETNVTISNAPILDRAKALKADASAAEVAS